MRLVVEKHNGEVPLLRMCNIVETLRFQGVKKTEAVIPFSLFSSYDLSPC